ncbi:hypothetical protein ILYODFUR_036050 [Ilyodon furcidens]|uniref:Uncharacterized protein n=1 Tax=Ilyodon furcidens TaxID=33524 RepID=A0ABV0TDX4_9TELE
MDSLFSINTPEALGFSEVASGLNGKEEEYSVNSLVSTMGDKADDILSTPGLNAADMKKYKPVKDVFDSNFIGKHNVIYKRGLLIKDAKNRGNWQNPPSLQFTT